MNLIILLNSTQFSPAVDYNTQGDTWYKITNFLNTTPRDLSLALSEYRNYVFPGMESLYILVDKIGMRGADFDHTDTAENL